jgi:hypothetical protein
LPAYSQIGVPGVAAGYRNEKRIPMNCAACGFEAAADFAFCPKCGTRLVAIAAPPSALRSTPAPTAAAIPASIETQSDRRPVTVLFADLSGFTTLSERLDPEDVRALQDDLFKEMSAAIERFEGFVENSWATPSWACSVRRLRTKTIRNARCARRSSCATGLQRSVSAGCVVSVRRSHCTSA